MNSAVAIKPAEDISIRQIWKVLFHDCDSRTIANPEGTRTLNLLIDRRHLVSYVDVIKAVTRVFEPLMDTGLISPLHLTV